MFLLGIRCYVFTTSQRGQSHSRTSPEVYITSQIGQFHLGTSCNVFATSQVRQSHLGNYWYVAMGSQINRFCLAASEMLWQRPKKVRLINMPVEMS